MIDLLEKIYMNIEEQKTTANSMQTWGIKRANAEYDYQTALSQDVLVDRDKGTAIGVIQLTCKGKVDIAKKRLERDIADVMYEVSKEKIQILKKEQNTLENQAQREWSVRE